MFRPMRRFKQQIADAQCKEILKTEKRGILSLLGDNGYPYALIEKGFSEVSTYLNSGNIIFSDTFSSRSKASASDSGFPSFIFKE